MHLLMITHLSTNRAQCWSTSLKQSTKLPTKPNLPHVYITSIQVTRWARRLEWHQLFNSYGTYRENKMIWNKLNSLCSLREMNWNGTKWTASSSLCRENAMQLKRHFNTVHFWCTVHAFRSQRAAVSIFETNFNSCWTWSKRLLRLL